METLTIFAIIFLDTICVLMGAYSGYKFFRAFLDGKDLMKYNGYLTNAFLMIIIFPLIITVGLIKFDGMQSYSIGVSVKVNDFRGTYGKMNMDPIRISSSGTKNMAIQILNKDEETKDLTVDIACISGSCKRDIVSTRLYEINVKPDIVFELPIVLNIYGDMSDEQHKYNITLQNENGSIYDYAILDIDIE